ETGTSKHILLFCFFQLYAKPIFSDIISIKRIEKVFSRFTSFPQRILSEKELLFFFENKSSPIFLAGRFAAKEAVLKALGTGLSKGIRFKDIEITSKNQSPLVVLKGEALKQFNSLSGSKIFLSISHEKDYAVATAILEK
ncbi:MAG: holo-ACP synthase, partial [Acidobacteria bacterium]|nr:holo-ACP synthase [Acidobacteriota bacterium]